MVLRDWEMAEPRADALIESTRGFGYSPEAAVADLVDNSISAGAKNIDIEFKWDGENSMVSVSDDGSGMSEDELSNAMRLGSLSPTEERADSDLGRFGLGLKTASFSQARELTVLTRNKASGPLAVRRWDLDTVTATREWRLHKTRADLRCPLDGKSRTGTSVVWSKLDRLVGEADVADGKAHARFLETTRRVHKHIEITFHRFLTGKNRVRITVNGQDAVPWDPFMTSHSATQVLPSETLPFRGILIRVHPYVPDYGAGINGWNQHQGFYVYRSDRLLVPGDWLGLGLTRDEHTKLARIAVEFPASADHAWQVDVKKSTARPPGELVDSLKRIARATRMKAEEVYRHRGKIIAHKNSKSFVFAWQQYKDRDGQVRYKINREHPVITAVLDAVAKDKKLVERALRFIEETVPTTMIGVSLSESLDSQPTPFGQAPREITPLARFVMKGLMQDGASKEEALATVVAAEPFSQFPGVIEALKELDL